MKRANSIAQQATHRHALTTTSPETSLAPQPSPVHSLDQVVRPDPTAAQETEGPFSSGDLSRPMMNDPGRRLKRKRWGAMGTRFEQKTTF
jgi:hypothetical protein